VLAETPLGFSITKKLQEKICLISQSQVFEDSEELLKSTMGIDISAKQIQRVSERYGQAIEEVQQVQIEEESAFKKPKDCNLAYLMFDGSMIYTREEAWKEIKVGRIFHADDVVKIQKNRSHIIDSLYVCHVGDHIGFFSKLEHYIEPYSHLICVADGAKWIWNFISDKYPDTIQILDFYHAMEKLEAYAKLQYNDAEKETWVAAQKQLLLSNQVGDVIEDVESQIPKNKEALKAKEQLVGYYKNNQCRMMYQTYKMKGYIIGSGAIESAHRNVVQQRLKLSGQRWTIKGAQEIVNLRACKKSNRWNELVNFIKNAA